MKKWIVGEKLAEQIKKNPDICYTQPEMAKYLINLVKFNKSDIVMEPCKGKGAFYNNLPENVVKKYCEIDEELDYLNYEGEVDITLSNPPFVPRKLFWSFMVKAMETTKREIYWLLNMSSLNVFSPKRLKEMENKNWYLENMHIVSDKRWFGRYVWIKITKNKEKNILTFTDKYF